MRSTSAAFRLPDSCTTEERVPDPICSQGSSALASNRAEAISQNTIILPFQEKRDSRETHECSHWLRNRKGRIEPERGRTNRTTFAKPQRARCEARSSQRASAATANIGGSSRNNEALRSTQLSTTLLLAIWSRIRDA